MNYYTNLCVKIEHHAKELKDIFEACDAYMKDLLTDGDLRTIFSSMKLDEDHGCFIGLTDNNTVAWLQDDEGTPNLEAVAKLVQVWIKRCNSEIPVVIQFAMTADKHTQDAFGGGVMKIYPDHTDYIDTVEIADADRAHLIEWSHLPVIRVSETTLFDENNPPCVALEIVIPGRNDSIVMRWLDTEDQTREQVQVMIDEAKAEAQETHYRLEIAVDLEDYPEAQ